MHKGRAFSKALLKMAQAKYFDLPDLRKTSEDEIIFQIERRMKAAGLRPGPGAAERFFQATGIDTAPVVAGDREARLFVGEREARTHARRTSTASSAAAAKCSSGISAMPCSAARRRPRWRSSPRCWRRMNRKSAFSSCWRGRCGWRRWRAVLRENKMLRVQARHVHLGGSLAPRAQAYLPRKKSGEPISTYALGQAAQRSQRRPGSILVRRRWRSFTARSRKC